MKSLVWLVVIIVVVVAGFFLLRGRPAGEPSGTPALTAAPTPTSAAGPAAEASPAAATAVAIASTGFLPARATVSAGSTVTFTNADTAPHQVASIPHPVHTNHPDLNGGVLQPGGTFSVTFSVPGAYGYHDHLNPGLTGTVVVQ